MNLHIPSVTSLPEQQLQTQIVCNIKVENAIRQFHEMLTDVSNTYNQAILQMQKTLGNEEIANWTVLKLEINENWKNSQIARLKELQNNNDSIGINHLYVQAKSAIQSCAIAHLNHARARNAKALVKKISFNSTSWQEKDAIEHILEKLIKNESVVLKASRYVKIAKKALKNHQHAYLKQMAPSHQVSVNSPLMRAEGHYAFNWSFSSEELFASSAKNLSDEHYSLLVDLFSQIDSPVTPSNLEQIEFLKKAKKVFGHREDPRFAVIRELNMEHLENIEENYNKIYELLNQWRTEKYDATTHVHTIVRTPIGGLSAQTYRATDSRNLWRVQHTIKEKETTQKKDSLKFEHHTYRQGNIVDSVLVNKNEAKALRLAKVTAKKGIERIVADEFSIGNHQCLRQHKGTLIYDAVSVSLQGGGLGIHTNDERMNAIQKAAYDSLDGTTLEVENTKFRANVICFAFASNESSACFQGTNSARFKQNQEAFKNLLWLITEKLPLKKEIPPKKRAKVRNFLEEKFLDLYDRQLFFYKNHAYDHLKDDYEEYIANFICEYFEIPPDVSHVEVLRIVKLIEDLGSLLLHPYAYRQNCPNEAPAKIDLLLAEINKICKNTPHGQIRQITNCKSAKDRTSREDAVTSAFIHERASSLFLNYTTYQEFFESQQRVKNYFQTPYPEFLENKDRVNNFFQKQVYRFEHHQLEIISFSNLYGSTGTKYRYHFAVVKGTHFFCKLLGHGAFHAAPETNTIFAEYNDN